MDLFGNYRYMHASAVKYDDGASSRLCNSYLCSWSAPYDGNQRIANGLYHGPPAGRAELRGVASVIVSTFACVLATWRKSGRNRMRPESPYGAGCPVEFSVARAGEASRPRFLRN